MEYVLLGLLVLGFFVIAPILGLIAFARQGSFERRLIETQFRLQAAETEIGLMRARLVGAPADMPPVPTAEPLPEAPVIAEPFPTPPPIPKPQPAAAMASVPVVANAGGALTPPPVPPPLPAPPGDLGSFEERFGSRWTVWVGAVALGLGAIFLVRFSIEQGLIGPELRILLAALLSIALLAGGEWLRRRDLGLPTLPVADIPSAVTGAGIVAAFGTVYAAYGLYDFIGPTLTFILLAAIGLGAMVLAGLHGPLLGGIGLIAAFGAPFLIESRDPSPYVFPLYAAVVTTSAFALAWIKQWRWIALAATVASAGLGLLVLIGSRGGELPSLIQAAIGIGSAALFLVPGIRFMPPRERGVDWTATLIVMAFLLLGAAAASAQPAGSETVRLVVFAVIAAGMIALGWRSPAVLPAVGFAGFLSALVVASIATGIAPPTAARDALQAPADLPDSISRTFLAGTLFALLFGALPVWLSVARRHASAGIVMGWSAIAVLVPLAIFAIVYLRADGFVVSPRFAALAMVLAALYGAASEAAHRLREGRRPGMAAASAIYAVGTLASLAFAMTLLLERAWLTLALAFLPAAIAYVYTMRPLPALRWVAALVGLGVLARLIWDPAINGSAGDWLVFNWLLIGYGVPALSCFVASILLRRRRGEDLPVQILEALALVFAALLVIVEVRHAFGAEGYRLFWWRLSFAEAATHTVTILAFGLGVSRLSGLRTSTVFRIAALAARIFALLWIGLVMGLVVNPFLASWSIGPHPIFNWALLGYLGAAVLAGLIAWFDRQAGLKRDARIAGLVALGLLFVWINVQIAALFRGSVLTRGIPSDGELYAYSVAWLVFGLALLAAGTVTGSRMLRLVSGGVVALAVVKVFLFDMAGLTGLWRALSFIGLGLALMVIGRIYQRALGLAGAKAKAPAPPAAPPDPT